MYSTELQEIEKRLNTDLSHGLTKKQARERFEQQTRDGNKKSAPLYLPESQTPIKRMLEPFRIVPLCLCLIITVACIAFGDMPLGVWGALLCAFQLAVIGIISAIAKKECERAQQFSSPMVKVYRGGNMYYTDCRGCVVGDLIRFSKGDVITCDARLIRSSELLVDEFEYDKSSRSLLRHQKKKNHLSEDSANSVLAGSVVLSGWGEAVVLKTSDDSLLSKHVNKGEMSGTSQSSGGISSIKTASSVMLSIMLTLLTVMCIIGYFTMRGRDVYYLLLCALASLSLICPSSLEIFARWFLRVSKKKLPAGTYIKTDKSNDILADLTDVIIMGKSGITDGTLHVSSVFLSGRRHDVQSIDAKPDRAFRVCEYIYAYLRATEKMSFPKFERYREGLEGFINQVGLDIEATELRIKGLYYLEANDEHINPVYAEIAGVRTVTATALAPQTPDRCKFIRVGDDTVEINGVLRERINSYVEECQASGERLAFVLSEEVDENYRRGESHILEGIIAFEEHTLDGLDSALAHLRGMGIKVSVMLSEETSENIKYLTESGIISSPTDGTIAYSSEYKKRGEGITSSATSKNVYMGFELSELAELISYKKKCGDRILALTVDDKYSGLASIADVCAACCHIDFSTRGHMDSVYESMPADIGTSTASISSPRVQTFSDIITTRTGDSIALEGIFKSVVATKSSFVSFAYFLKFLLPISFACAFLCLLSVISGIELIGATQVLIIHALICSLGVYFFSHSHPTDELLRNIRHAHLMPTALIKNSAAVFLPHALAGILSFVEILIFILLGLIKSAQGISFALFLSICVCIFCDLFLAGAEFSDSERNRAVQRRAGIIMILMLVGVLTVCVGAIFVYSRVETGILANVSLFICEICGTRLNIPAVILILPSYAFTYFFARKFLSKHLISFFTVKKREWL